jgi:transposase
MKPYSLDLRQKIVEAYDRGEGSVRELAERFMVSPNTVQNYLTRRRRTGDLAPAPHGGGPPRLLKRDQERVLLALQRAHNDRTDAEYAKLFTQRTGMHVSRRTINRAWRRLGITRKKKVLHASERDRPDVQRARRAFREEACRARRRRFIFVDEFGTNLGMTRRYGRARRGHRVVGKVPLNTDPNVTLTMGLSREGIVAPVVFTGGTNGPSFVRYVREYLSRELHRGDIVVLDRLGAHRAREARRIVERCGASFWLLPAYSPDLNPVEEAGAKVKAYVRGKNPRSRKALYRALDDAVRVVTARDAHGWFSERARYLFASTSRVRPPL